MYYDNQEIKPFIGIGDIKIGETYENIVSILKSHKIIYSMGIDPNKGCTPQVEWKTIYIKNYMNLVFAEDILFQINFDIDFKGNLKNGIKINTKMTEALKIDKTLEYDDWNEIWQSEDGYWLLDTVESGKVYMFSIGIKEMFNDDEFYLYKWLKKYKIIKK